MKHNIVNMGASESKSVMRRSNSSASSFGRVSYASPSYRINSPNYKASFQNLKQRRLAGYDQGLSERNQLIRTNSLDLGGPPTVGEHTMLMPPAAGAGDSKYSTFKDLGAEVGLSSPPIAQWLVPALCCAMAYALYNIFIKKGSASIHPILGGVILQFVAAIIGTVLCLSLAFGPTQEEMFYDSTGVMYALLAGASV